MALRSGMFNSVNGDRKYNAESFAEYFASFIGNGIFPNPSNNFKVMANSGMTLNLSVGKAWINGYFIVNDSPYAMQLDVADGIMNRIDRIVLQLNFVNREIVPVIKKGDLAAEPVAPPIERNNDIHELSLATVYVGAGVLSILDEDITDTRLDSAVCGIVHGTVDQVDTTDIFNQYLDWFNRTKATAQTDLDNMESQLRADWDEWFSGVQGALDGDTAGNLYNMINDLAGSGRTTETVKRNADNLASHQLTKASPTALGHIMVGDGLSISSEGVLNIPRGIIVMWSGDITTVPAGWALCNGQNGTPDLRDRFIVGAGNSYVVGNTGGVDSVTLTTAQLPSHSHGVGTLSVSSGGSHSHSFSGSTSSAGSHTHRIPTYTYDYGGLYGADGRSADSYSTYAQTDSAGSHTHSFSGSTSSSGSHSHSLSGSTATAGSGQAHENRPPYYALAFIMKL